MPSFFFNDPAPPEIPPLPHPAPLPISSPRPPASSAQKRCSSWRPSPTRSAWRWRSEEHTSELQSQSNLVCPLFFLMIRRPPRSPLFPTPPLSRSRLLAPPRVRPRRDAAHGGRRLPGRRGG